MEYKATFLTFGGKRASKVYQAVDFAHAEFIAKRIKREQKFEWLVSLMEY